MSAEKVLKIRLAVATHSSVTDRQTDKETDKETDWQRHGSELW